MEAHSVPRSGAIAYPRSPRLLAALGDERLVELIRRGNDAAFEVVYDRHHRGILAFCRHMLASTEEAEDAVQHTFVQAYNSIRAGDRELKLKPWLYAIARNRCISLLRARREEAAELQDIPTAGLSEAVQQRSDLRELLADIRELPVDQRAALVLSEVGDLSHGDIATVVGCPVSKVKSLVFQARTSLMETRKAREIPCQEIREQLASATGGALRRAPLRRHVAQCEGCAEFRDEVRRQRAMLAAAMPVIPSLALKKSALAAIGLSGGAGGAAAGGGAAGGLATILGGGGAMKAIAILAVGGAVIGGGVAISELDSQGAPEKAGVRRTIPSPSSIKALPARDPHKVARGKHAATGKGKRAGGRRGASHRHVPPGIAKVAPRGHSGGVGGVEIRSSNPQSTSGGGSAPYTTRSNGPPVVPSAPGAGGGTSHPTGPPSWSNSGGNGGGSGGGGSSATAPNGNAYGQQYDTPSAPPGHQDDHFRNGPPPRGIGGQANGQK
jgi:RNA polymerase sigma factor (sigma-70 family)